MQSKIDQDVIEELIAMLEDHIAGGMKPKQEEIPGVEALEGDSAEGGSQHEASEAPADEDEELKKLMELYSKD